MEILAKKFASVEQEIRNLTKTLKTLREDKTALSEQLLECMIQEKVDSIQMNDHSIVIKTAKQYGALNKEYLQNALGAFCETSVPKDSKTFAEKATEHVLTNRDVIEKPCVKLIKRK